MNTKKFYAVLETKENGKYYVCGCPIYDNENALHKINSWAGKSEIVSCAIVGTRKEMAKRVEFYRQGYKERGLYAFDQAL